MVEQKIEPLSRDDSDHLEKQRSWVRDHFEESSRHKYDSIDDKLRLVQTIIDANWIEPTETWKLQSLGVSFGDSLAQKLEMSWVAVEDEVGRTPALRLEGSSLVLFPVTAISKRVERGESVDVRDLFDDFCKVVADKLALGY
jgi:hypothetical protein